MTIFFSASNAGFYDDERRSQYERGAGWPVDAVEVTESERQEYLQAPPAGKKLGEGDNGKPAWVTPPPPTLEDIIAAASLEKSRLRAVADAEITWRQDAVDAEIATEQEGVELTAWKKYRVLLMRTDTAAPVWPTVPEA